MAATFLYVITILPWFHVSSTNPPDERQSSMACNNCCQGVAGVPGVPGAAGIPGAPGGFGLPGPLGPKGESGMPGISIKGEKGNAGISIKGEKGNAGVVGPSGPRGELGLQGSPGKVGPMGIRGSRGANGLDGTVGNQGLKGEKGEAGSTAFAGFTVAKTSSQRGGGIVTFDTVITDVAGEYDTSTHKFTCSVPGYYLFTINAGSQGSEHPWIQLVHNGNLIVHAYDYGTTQNMASNSALILLAVGDQVWMNNGHSNEQVYAHSTLRVTTFTGILLHATT